MTSTEAFFDALKSHRESQNIEISEICEFTKINQKYIQAIESGDFTVLPTVYMRLFLRAYAEFIGADSAKALEDYELLTTGTIQKKTDIDLKSSDVTEQSQPNIDFENETPTQVTPQKIATGVAVIIGLFLVLYWAGQITSEQNIELENTPAPAETISPETPSETPIETTPSEDANPDIGAVEKKSPIIDKPAVSPDPVEGEPRRLAAELVETSNFPNKLPLNSNDFLAENKNRESTNILKLFAPFTITITTLEETKLNLSKITGGVYTVLINEAIEGGKEFEFDFESTINFEFWSNAHIKVKLNEIPLDNFLSDDGLSIRGSYEAEKSQLYLGFYQN
jgi:transcriptional regulator with XRE-family HTH domain